MKGVYILEELNMTAFAVLWLTQIRCFILIFPGQIFLVVFFCQLLQSSQFLKKSQNCNVTNFCIISNLFPHKYNDKNFNKGTCETSFPGKPRKPVSLRNQSPCETGFLGKPVSLRNQYWMQKFCKSLMQKSFVSYWCILKIR